MVATLSIRAVEPTDISTIERLLTERWGSYEIVSRGQIHDALKLPGFVAIAANGTFAGLITLHYVGDSTEIVTLDAVVPRQGIGSQLFEAALNAVQSRKLRRLWLVTSNDNLEAIKFYERHGMRICAVHEGAIDEARKLKPCIPLVAHNGLPIRDEVELEVVLAG